MGNPELSVKVWQQQIADSKTQLGYKAWKSNRYQAMQKAAGHKTIEESGAANTLMTMGLSSTVKDFSTTPLP